jgi:FkbM family methyltransferase
VYSFELNVFNYNNLLRLSSDNCICENLAISDKKEIIDVYSDNEKSGNHISNIVGHDTSFRKMESIGKVKSISLDEYFKNKNVDYMKIDVEGAEFRVIKGGIETFRKCKLVIIECHYDEDWMEMSQFLIDNNLEFRNIVNDEIVKYGECLPIPGRSSIGRPYQMYLIK